MTTLIILSWSSLIIIQIYIYMYMFMYVFETLIVLKNVILILWIRRHGVYLEARYTDNILNGLLFI